MVARHQRFRKAQPCPICGSYEEARRGTGQRCDGWRSDDGRYAHCAREQYAGDLPPEPNGRTYAHRLEGDCRCGVRHDPHPPAPQTSRNGHQRPRIVATYNYVDADDQLLYQVVRYRPKAFRQRRPDGQGGWIWQLDGVPRVLYRLPEVLEAIASGQVICVAEGEADVEALRRHGYTATTNAQGAGKWQEAYSQTLRDAHDVVLFADQDEAGRAHLAQVNRALRAVGLTPRLAQLEGLPEHGDIRDWLQTHGQEELDQLIAAARPLEEESQAADQDPAADQPPYILTRQKRLVSCQHNALLWLIQHGHASHIWLDTFRQVIMVEGQPLDDDVIIELVRQIEASTLTTWAQAWGVR